MGLEFKMTKLVSSPSPKLFLGYYYFPAQTSCRNSTWRLIKFEPRNLAMKPKATAMKSSFPMKGGNGPNSYVKNSKYQETGSNEAKLILRKSIEESLNVNNDFPVFSIADFGCSVGPNTFGCVQTIIEAVQLKNHGQDHLKMPEFQVFFNDVVSNDFNTLFASLPPDRQYMAAGVPGSFHGRVFPAASINVMHTAFSTNWLTRVPEEVTREGSPAWNKGRITYVLSSNQVKKAYTTQFMRDMEAFLISRSEELAADGLLAILMPCRPDGTPPSGLAFIHLFELLGHALVDMVKEGVVKEEDVDSFNVPLYYPSASELKQVISSSNKHHHHVIMSIERIEEVDHPVNLSTPQDAQFFSKILRAASENLFFNHFECNVVDELFTRHIHKIEEFSKTPIGASFHTLKNLFILLKRN